MFERYKIHNGENLDMIAKNFKTSVDYLKDINNIVYEDMLRAGMEIVVPKEQEQYFNIYTVEAGDNLYEISRRYNINPSLLASMNGLDLDDYIYKNQELLIPKNGYSYYITKDGDTLETVSGTFDSSKESLLRHNPTIYLLEGQLLVDKK